MLDRWLRHNIETQPYTSALIALGIDPPSITQPASHKPSESDPASIKKNNS
jgi:hypothetical protein